MPTRTTLMMKKTKYWKEREWVKEAKEEIVKKREIKCKVKKTKEWKE